MFPGMGGMNPAQMKQLMRQLGIKTEDIKAKRVIFELEGKNLILENPAVTSIIMQGQKIFNVIGDPKEESQLPDADIVMVAEQANVSNEKAKKALEENEGDIAKAILSLKK